MDAARRSHVESHPSHRSLAAGQPQGVGLELRLHGRDPDEAEAAARRLGTPVRAGAADKRRGLREAYLLDPDGYLRVVDVPRPV